MIDSYSDASKEELPWLMGVKGHIERNNLGHLFPNLYPNRHPFIYKKVYDHMVTKFHQDALSTISNPEHKLRTYALFKVVTGREVYLKEIKNVEIRKQLTKFRISDHSLMIETGRHRGIDKCLRFCPFCPNQVEDEIHFLVKCPVYSSIRKSLIDPLLDENTNPREIPDTELFLAIMANSQKEIANFILKAFELRKYLVDNPKRTD